MKAVFAGIIFLFAVTIMASGAENRAIEPRIVGDYLESHGVRTMKPDRPLFPWKDKYKTAAEYGINDFMHFLHKPGQSGDLYAELAKAYRSRNFKHSIGIGIPRRNLMRDWYPFLKEYCAKARNARWAATVNGRPVIWTYQARAAELEEWNVLKEKLEDDGFNPFIIGDMNAFALTREKEYLATIDQWARVFDGLYFFAQHVNDKVIDAMVEASRKAELETGKPRVRALSVGGGYWRWARDAQGGSQLYDGTYAYERSWQRALKWKDDIDWIHLCTWNDALEHTHIQPSRHKSDVYARLTLEYGAKFKNNDVQLDERYWLTVPTEVRNGPGGLKEYVYEVRGQAIPRGGKQNVVVTLTKDNGEQILKKRGILTPDNSRYHFEYEPPEDGWGNVRYLVASAAVNDDGEEALFGQLYIPVWPSGEAATKLYELYKCPKTVRLLKREDIPVAPSLALSPSGELRVHPLPSAGNRRRRVEILYDMHMKGSEGINLGEILLGRKQLPREAPTDPFCFKRGFRHAVLISDDGRVAWSKPLWVPKELPYQVNKEQTYRLSEFPSAEISPIKINFQDKQTIAPAHYNRDTGEAFGKKGENLYYGWSRNVEVFRRNRKIEDDPLYDTLIPLSYYISSWFWEIALPPGTYDIKIVAGDPAFKKNNTLNVEGEQVLDTTPSENQFDEYLMKRTVNDGRLTISGTDGGNASLCFLEIAPE